MVVTRDLKDRTSIGLSIQPDDQTATVDGSSVDLQGFNAATAYVLTGDRSDGTITFQLQESDDASSWSAVADADLDGTEPVVDEAADADSVFEVAYRGTSRYLRWQISSVSGITDGAECVAFIQRGLPSEAPA